MIDPTGKAPTDTAFTRRSFLHRGVALASLATTTPMFIARTADATGLPAGSLLSSHPGVPEDHILVVVQLGGGNDGLNTVVPYGQASYQRLRPSLALRGPGANGGVLQLDQGQGIGLNPAFSDFKELFDEGRASIIQGVGYPNPNRSHFASMDIWHTANTDGNGNGWIGRYFDNQCNGSPEPMAGVAIGNTTPRAMTGDTTQPVNVEAAERLQWYGARVDETLDDPYETITRAGVEAVAEEAMANPQLEFLTRMSMDAQLSSDRIRAALAKQSLVKYPRSALSTQLKSIASMIREGLPTRVYYASQSGFDTHANQANTHNRLLSQVGSSIKAFQEDLTKQGNNTRVLTMVFSEFGRRVAQNSSGGTDHGTAAPMYFVGDMVRPGLLGVHPDLAQLDRGDLIHTVDFRNIYAAVLRDWMGADPTAVLGSGFEAARILKG